MTDTPRQDELEVSIFGPGYGEAIALHLGSGNWICVDCCIDPESKKPAQLQYLQSLEIDVREAVKLIIATHWHDDHVQGIGRLVRECPSAEVAVSAALTSEHFDALLDYYCQGVFPGSSGVSELVEVFQILNDRKKRGTRIQPPQLAAQDMMLYRNQLNVGVKTCEVEVHAVSPSSSSILSANLDFRQRVPTVGQMKMRIVCPSTNNTSVVLWVKVGEQKILLGSDLENNNDPTKGWKIIIDKSKSIQGRAEVYKVSHHGAESAHDDEIWSKLLTKDPHALVSPFSVGAINLPTQDDINRISNLTKNGYITAPIGSRKYRIADRAVREMVQRVTKSIESVNVGWGQIRLRRNIFGGSYDVKFFGDAHKISDS